MADSVNKRKIMIAMDGSENSEGALKCKYFYRFFSEVFFFSSCRGVNVDIGAYIGLYLRRCYEV